MLLRSAWINRPEWEEETLLDYLEGGESLDAFLDDFPTVSRERAVEALEQAKDARAT